MNAAKLNSFSPEFNIYLRQQNIMADLFNETTYKRNAHEFASYEETVIHVILTTHPEGQFYVWQLANGKCVDETMLDRMVKEKLLTRKSSGRGMYKSVMYKRTF